MWPLIIVMVAAFVLVAVTAPKQKSPKPTAFGDFDFPRCDEGTEKSVLFGQAWTKDWMVLSVRNQRTQAIKSKGGKK